MNEPSVSSFLDALAAGTPTPGGGGAAAEGVRLAAQSVEHGNVNVISDVGVGVLASAAALRSAALNVHVNVPQIQDRVFTDQVLSELEALTAECLPLADQVQARVQARMG